MESRAHHNVLRLFEDIETRLVALHVQSPERFEANELLTLRHALSLARITKISTGERTLDLSDLTASFRSEIFRRLNWVVTERGPVSSALLRPHLHELPRRSMAAYRTLVGALGAHAPREVLDRELSQKALALVLGGGGAPTYVYLGVFEALRKHNLVPQLLSGTSMGALLALFRSHLPSFDQLTGLSVVRSLAWTKLFRAVSTESRYGIPAALRLTLRAGIGQWFGVDQHGSNRLPLSALPIKTLINITAVRAGRLPRPLAFYQSLGAPEVDTGIKFNLAPQWMLALSEFFLRPDIITSITLGLDNDTAQFDALDAAGFSSALPGIIHYDVLRDDSHMHGLLAELMRKRRVTRFIDGGLTSNLPARAAARAIRTGAIGTRNAFILALNAFAPRWTTPLWLPLQSLAASNVAKDKPSAHLAVDFSRTLSPLSIIPSVAELLRAHQWGQDTIERHLPFIRKMLEPLAPFRFD
jgi:hypothetical protein